MDYDANQPTDAQRYGICSAGFWIAGIALGLLGLSGALFLWVVFTADRALLLAMQQPGWTWAVDLPITAGALLGSLLLVGRWPDRSWRWRAGLLAAMNGFDAVTWALTHHDLLGFEADLGRHEWLVENLGMLFGWAEFLLFAHLATEVAIDLGTPSAVGLYRGVVRFSIAGLALSALVFATQTRWGAGWPPAPALGRNPADALMSLGVALLRTITSFQAAMLCIIAGTSCRHTARHLAEQRVDVDPFEAVSRYGTPRSDDEDNRADRR